MGNKYIIVGPPFDFANPMYRGTYRVEPPYWQQLPPESRYNTLALWYEAETERRGWAEDLEALEELMNLATRVVNRAGYDILAVGAEFEGHQPRRFIGYDLSWRFRDSLLVGGLDFSFLQKIVDEFALSPPPADVRRLIRIVQNEFRPLLNRWGLFDERAHAEGCLRVLSQAVRKYPHIAEQYDYEVTGLVIVRSTIKQWPI